MKVAKLELTMPRMYSMRRATLYLTGPFDRFDGYGEYDLSPS